MKLHLDAEQLPERKYGREKMRSVSIERDNETPKDLGISLPEDKGVSQVCELELTAVARIRFHFRPRPPPATEGKVAFGQCNSCSTKVDLSTMVLWLQSSSSQVSSTLQPSQGKQRASAGISAGSCWFQLFYARCGFTITRSIPVQALFGYDPNALKD